VPGLRFLAAKTATHTPAFHAHGVVVQAQRMRHPVLHLAGVLGAGVHTPLVFLLRQHVGNLTFQVKVLLATHFKRAAQAVRRTGQRLRGVATVHKHGRQHIVFSGQCLLDG
jgi:hypothetical protein